MPRGHQRALGWMTLQRLFHTVVTLGLAYDTVAVNALKDLRRVRDFIEKQYRSRVLAVPWRTDC